MTAHLSLSEAAKQAQTSRRTIERRLHAGQFPNAHKATGGSWQIPVTDLLAAGVRLNAPTPPDPAPEVSEVEHLREALAIAETRASEAEARARIAEIRAEGALQNAEDLRTALRMLAAGPSEASTGPHSHRHTSLAPTSTPWYHQGGRYVDKATRRLAAYP